MKKKIFLTKRKLFYLIKKYLQRFNSSFECQRVLTCSKTSLIFGLSTGSTKPRPTFSILMSSKQPVRNEPVKPVIGFKIYEPLFFRVSFCIREDKINLDLSIPKWKKVVKMRLKNARNYFFRRLLNFLQQKLKSRFSLLMRRPKPELLFRMIIFWVPSIDCLRTPLNVSL